MNPAREDSSERTSHCEAFHTSSRRLLIRTQLPPHTWVPSIQPRSISPLGRAGRKTRRRKKKKETSNVAAWLMCRLWFRCSWETGENEEGLSRGGILPHFGGSAPSTKRCWMCLRRHCDVCCCMISEVFRCKADDLSDLLKLSRVTHPSHRDLRSARASVPGVHAQARVRPDICSHFDVWPWAARAAKPSLSG